MHVLWIWSHGWITKNKRIKEWHNLRLEETSKSLRKDDTFFFFKVQIQRFSTIQGGSHFICYLYWSRDEEKPTSWIRNCAIHWHSKDIGSMSLHFIKFHSFLWINLLSSFKHTHIVGTPFFLSCLSHLALLC